jgi:cytochrome c5
MSQHHTDPVEENIEIHPVKLAIAIGIGAVALIVGIVMLASFAVGSYGLGVDSKAMTPEETVKRIAPVAKLVVETASTPGNTPAAIASSPAPGKSAAPAVIPAAIPPASPAATGKADGNAVYSKTCSVCHASGVAGAPKFGDKAAWAARIKSGAATLYASALKGKGAMPSKGGNTTLSDADVKAAVDYMVSQAK